MSSTVLIFIAIFALTAIKAEIVHPIDKLVESTPSSNVKLYESPEKCGRALVMTVLSICGESCSPKTGSDVVDTVCNKNIRLSEEELRAKCCP